MTFGYAEAWGLTYFLIKSKPKQFAAYIKILRERMPGNQSTPKERIEIFQRCFGDDLGKTDKEFMRFLQNVH
jgi:hypothetical protein